MGKVAYEQRFDNDHRVVARPTHGLPFAYSSRGVLVHRVRSAIVFHIHAEPHAAYSFWCGMTGTYSDDQRSHGRGSYATLVDEPPKDRLVCWKCEAVAVAAGQKSSDSLVGRHVHVGGVKAVRRCCNE